MSDRYRDRLVAARPEAEEYRELVEALPENVAGLKGRIAELNIFPIKALGKLALEQALVGPNGISTADGHFHDRMAMLVYPKEGEHDGTPYTHMRYSQRENGDLVLLRPEITVDGLRYRVRDSVEDLVIEPGDLAPREGERVMMKMGDKGNVHSGILENGRITDWIRKALRVEQVSLLIPDREFSRVVDGAGRTEEESGTLYSDGGQLLVANRATLDWMNESMAAKYGVDFAPMEMDAFRPNIVLEDLPANAEDVIARLRIFGDHPPEMRFALLCVRCPVTKVMQGSGEKRKKEPLAWLAKNRPPRIEGDKNSVTFAVNADFRSQDNGRIVTVGDKFEVMAEKA